MPEAAFDPVPYARPSGDAAASRRLAAEAARRTGAHAETALARFAQQAIRGGGEPAIIEQAMTAAFLIKGQSGDAGVSILGHPAFCHWMKGAYRLAGSGVAGRAGWVRHIADFLWPLAARDGAGPISWRTALDDRGGLRCIPGRRFFELGPDRAGAEIVIESDPESAYFRVRFEDGGNVHIPFEDLNAPAGHDEPALDPHGFAINRLPEIGDGRIEFGHRDPALRVHFTGTHQRKTGVDFFAVADDIMDPAPDAARFDEMLSRLRELWPAAATDVEHFVRALVPVRSEGDKRLGFTVSSRQGAVFLEDTDDRSLLHNLVHEMAHIKLRHLQLFDMMMDDWADETRRFTVPWRDDPRPLAGIFEGVFVFSHVRELESRMVAAGLSRDAREADELGAHIAFAADILFAHAPLTQAGRALLGALSEWAGEEATAAAA